MSIVSRNCQESIASLSLIEKEKRLIKLMDSALKLNAFEKEISHIVGQFNLSRAEIVQAFLDYNMDVHSHDNKIYKSQSIRVVLHLHNQIQGSWHINRQEAVSKFIKKAAPRKAIDLGFGVPSRYIKELLNSAPFQLTLCDNKQSAFTFAEEVLNLWHPNWSEKISFLCEDMENIESCVGDYDLYISLHSIEHVPNPTKCLADYVKHSKSDSMFLIEIPIGPITPEHYMSWDSVNQAREWVNSFGLEILDQHLTHVNPEVDLFADVHKFNYSGYLMLCKKVQIV